MTPCLSCNRHVREEVCPFCGAKCVQNTSARKVIARAARSTLLLAALSDCSSHPSPAPMYGAVCVDDSGCVVPPVDAATDGAPEASQDASDAATDAPDAD
jgi:hypothetical protein